MVALDIRRSMYQNVSPSPSCVCVSPSPSCVCVFLLPFVCVCVSPSPLCVCVCVFLLPLFHNTCAVCSFQHDLEPPTSVTELKTDNKTLRAHKETKRRVSVPTPPLSHVPNLSWAWLPSFSDDSAGPLAPNNYTLNAFDFMFPATWQKRSGTPTCKKIPVIRKNFLRKKIVIIPIVVQLESRRGSSINKGFTVAASRTQSHSRTFLESLLCSRVPENIRPPSSTPWVECHRHQPCCCSGYTRRSTQMGR